MITKNQVKLIKSLALKKNRVKHQLFVVEGRKSVSELLKSDYTIKLLFATNKWADDHPNFDVVRVSLRELARITNYNSADDVLAIVKIKKNKLTDNKGVTLVLDNLNIPGNVGTIIRTCDWFGVSSIICSKDTVDIYNPKVIQASMGSIFRVNIVYTNLVKYLRTINSPVYAACLLGTDLRKQVFAKEMHLLVGNEANGVRDEILKLVDGKVNIKNPGSCADSLNVAVATSILLYEILS